jgi:hypothetical protein
LQPLFPFALRTHEIVAALITWNVRIALAANSRARLFTQLGVTRRSTLHCAIEYDASLSQH